MKVVALISGGKDSCYNMLMCEQYGHEIVALGNLLPEDTHTDELDSYMYQTVGHQVIEAYAQCCGLPLYRRRIQGGSHQQKLVYEDTEGDEVEDLYCLLAYVLQQMPEVQAVASGAIASDYQRTRVERVCARLGLVSLAYLWHQPQAPLLQCMIDSHIDAILVKVAAAGLTPAQHLGARLASLPAQLAKLRRLYGCNVCGEGGEYESLTLDCPLFKFGRIVLDSWQTVTMSEDSLAPVAVLHPTAFHVESKIAEGGGGRVVQVPPNFTPPPPPPRQQPAAPDAALPVLLNTAAGAAWVSIAAEVTARGLARTSPDQRALPAAFRDPPNSGDDTDKRSATTSTDTRVEADSTDGQGLSSPPADAAAPTTTTPPPEPCLATSRGDTAAMLHAALRRVERAMSAQGLSWQDALFVHLYVPSMADFAAANEAYCAYLPPVNPPARATVEIPPCDNMALVVEVLFGRRPEGRRVLHVQSLSEWAPSCIGPYSQGLSQGGLLLMAGQIPLHPPTMTMVGGGVEAQCARALQTCQAVAVALRSDLPRSMLWCTVYVSAAAGAAGAQQAQRHLAAFLEEEQEGGRGAGGESGDDSDPGFDPGRGLALDEYLVPPPMRRHWRPLQTYLLVPELPKGALVEIQPVACVADPTLDQSSPSDDSGDEANPPGGSGGVRMPGWIGTLEERWGRADLAASKANGDAPGSDSAAGKGEGAAEGALAVLSLAEEEGGACDCRQLFSPGRLCRAQLSLKIHGFQDQIQGFPGIPGKDASSAPTLPKGAPWQDTAVAKLLRALRRAGLGPADVASLKVYCPGGRRGVEQGKVLRSACMEGLGIGVQATLVPVCAVGLDASMQSSLLMECTAVREPGVTRW